MGKSKLNFEMRSFPISPSWFWVIKVLPSVFMTNNYSILLEIAPEQSSVQILLFFYWLFIHSGTILSCTSSKTSNVLYILRQFLKVDYHALIQLLSPNVVPQISRISITWEFVRNADSQTRFRLIPSQTVGMELGSLCFSKPSKWFWYTLKFENCGLVNVKSSR